MSYVKFEHTNMLKKLHLAVDLWLSTRQLERILGCSALVLVVGEWINKILNTATSANNQFYSSSNTTLHSFIVGSND